MNINFEYAKRVFEEYLDSYNREDEKINEFVEAMLVVSYVA